MLCQSDSSALARASLLARSCSCASATNSTRARAVNPDCVPEECELSEFKVGPLESARMPLPHTASATREFRAGRFFRKAAFGHRLADR